MTRHKTQTTPWTSGSRHCQAGGRSLFDLNEKRNNVQRVARLLIRKQTAGRLAELEQAKAQVAISSDSYRSHLAECAECPTGGVSWA